jgi:hypothetical protein
VQRNEASVAIDAAPEAVYARILDPADRRALGCRARRVRGDGALAAYREVVSDHGMRTHGRGRDRP